jgi:hypothetical protein
VFLVNSGANEAFDCFYNDLKQWGRYDLVDSPDAADLVIEIGVHSQNGGTRVWSATNVANGQTQVFSAPIVGRFMTLSVYDAKSKTLLWSISDQTIYANRKKNQDKELLNAEHRLVANFEGTVGCGERFAEIHR